MLRIQSCSKIKIDIKKYPNSLVSLKQFSEGHQPKNLNIFSKQNIFHFLEEAFDKQHFINKVALIVEVAGTCSKGELTLLRVENVGRRNLLK